MGFKEKLKPLLENVILAILGILIIFFYILSKTTPENLDFDHLDSNYSISLPTIPTINMNEYRTDLGALSWPHLDDDPSNFKSLDSDTINSQYSDDGSSNLNPQDSDSSNLNYSTRNMNEYHTDLGALSWPHLDDDPSNFKFLDSDTINSQYSDDGSSNLNPQDSATNFNYSDNDSSNVDSDGTVTTDSYYSELVDHYNLDSTKYNDVEVSTHMDIQLNFTFSGFYRTHIYFQICINLDKCGILNLIPEVKSRARELLEIDLRNSPLNEIEESVFIACSELRVLRLMFSRIGAIKGSMLYGLDTLVDLNLTRNEISLIENGAFDQLESLKYLDLSYNRIMEINNHTFDGLDNLVVLNLRHNKLHDLEDFAFENLNSLQVLDVSNNQIIFLAEYIVNLYYMDYTNLSATIDFSGNNLSNINMLFYGNQRNFDTLTFSYNKLDFIKAYAFIDSKISNLDLSHNQLSTINECIFEDAKILYLNLSYNNLFFFNASTYKGIEHIDLSHNKITSSDFNLRRKKLFKSKFLNSLNSKPSKLYVLDLSHNFITTVQLGSTLDSLRVINLDNNRIKFFTLDNPNVRELMLRNNLVEYFNSFELEKLRKCNLVNNKIPCARLDEALLLLDCIRRSPEGVKQITCIEDARDILYDPNFLFILNILLVLGILCLFMYYMKIIIYSWVSIKMDKR